MNKKAEQMDYDSQEGAITHGDEASRASQVGHIALNEEAEIPEVITEGYYSSDPVQQYLYEISQTPLLKSEDEVDLAKKIEVGVFAKALLITRENQNEQLVEQEFIDRFGDEKKTPTDLLLTLQQEGEEARQHFMQANLRLVVSIAKHYQGKNVDFLDLIQMGSIGLHRAVEKFDYTKGYKFSTYASTWILQAIQNGIPHHDRTIRLPQQHHVFSRKVSRKMNEFYQQFGREPSPQELARELETTVEKVEDSMQISQVPTSIHKPIGEETSAELGDMIPDDGANDPYENVEALHRAEAAHTILAGLSELESDLIARHYGLYDGEPWSTDRLAEHYHVKKPTVKEWIYKAMQRLRNDPDIAHLKELIS